MADLNDMDDSKLVSDKCYVKLIKNSKNYNWELKAFEGAAPETFRKIIEVLEEANVMMQGTFNTAVSE